MADIDPILLSAELDITVLLAVQIVLGVIALVIGYVGGRRWARIVFPVALVIAAAACGVTQYRCADTRESTRGRLDGRVPGPHLPAERAENHINWVADRGWLSIGIAAATWLVGGLLFCAARRARPAEPGRPPGHGDPK